MQSRTVFEGESLRILDLRCTAGPGDRPYVEAHARHSVSFVRKGSFGARALGKAHEFVSGSVMIGYPGLEYVCTHEHHDCGDKCLSFQLAPELAESTSGRAAWRTAHLPPL